MATTIAQRLHCLFGLVVLVGIAWALSSNRRKVRLRIILWGLGLQFAFAALVLKTAPGRLLFDALRDVVGTVVEFAGAGGDFVFGSLMRPDKFGFLFFAHVSAIIIFFSSLMSVLYHLGVMQKVVLAAGQIMKWTMRVSGAESLAAAANVFVGMTEAPLVIRPYVPGMTKSELMALMTSGFATIAGSVLMIYVGMFQIDAGHLLAASVMSAPASLVMAKLLIPETEEATTAGHVEVQFERETANVVDAAAAGAGVGVKLAVNVCAMVLAFVALVAFVNHVLGVYDGWIDPWLQAHFGFTIIPASLQNMFGFVFRPLAFCMGVESGDCMNFGNLLGQKIVLNEMLAYQSLQQMVKDGAMAPRSITMATYALCGFANFGSLAITIGGISTIAPGRRQDLAKLGLRAVAGGAMASFMTACVAGALL